MGLHSVRQRSAQFYGRLLDAIPRQGDDQRKQRHCISENLVTWRVELRCGREEFLPKIDSVQHDADRLHRLPVEESTKEVSLHHAEREQQCDNGRQEKTVENGLTPCGVTNDRPKQQDERKKSHYPFRDKLGELPKSLFKGRQQNAAADAKETPACRRDEERTHAETACEVPGIEQDEDCKKEAAPADSRRKTHFDGKRG